MWFLRFVLGYNREETRLKHEFFTKKFVVFVVVVGVTVGVGVVVVVVVLCSKYVSFCCT
jgi:hypothetical protein